jgi:ferredoxin
MNPLFILKAFDNGADGVLVSGCHPGDCHYVRGNLVARRRFTVFRAVMDFIGLDLDRLHFAWVSAAEGLKWTRVVEELTSAVRKVGPAPGWKSFGTTADVTFEEIPASMPATDLLTSDQQDGVAGHLRQLAKTLLDEGKVVEVLGYVQGSLPGRSIPGRFRVPEEAAAMTWNGGCLTNLSAYLTDHYNDQKTALVVKRCDAQSICTLVREGQVNRDDLVLIGAQCSGGGLQKCQSCSGEASPTCDWIVNGDGITQGPREEESDLGRSTERLDAEIAALEKLPADERWKYWQTQFDACLRCYACRSVCPLCYCETCIANQHRPQWISTTIDARGNSAWNIVRALHLAGRCSSCGECSRVCPANLRLDLLNRRVEQEIERRFGFPELPGDPSALSVFNLFRMDDPDDYIR